MAARDPLSISVTGAGDLAKMVAFLDAKTFDKARRGGVTAAARSVPKIAGKSIGQRYNLKAGRIKEDIRGPFIRDDQATLIFASRPPTITQFGFRAGTRPSGQPGLGRGRGWGPPSKPGRHGSATIIKGRRLQYPSTFLAPSGSGAMLPFRRGKGFTRNGKPKLEVEYGPSIASIFSTGSFSPLIKTEIELEINARFIAGYQRVLNSAARGYGGR